MLVELLVENYAVVERLRVRFHRGLNLLTGETGSGKSLVVGALGLLFGSRASPDMVRSGAGKARISGIFELPPGPGLAEVLERSGVETEDGELLLERELVTGGKSRAFAGNRPVTVALLKQLAPFLGDIHGQHDQQRLFAAETQLEMLDEFAETGGLAGEVAGIYGQWRQTAAELASLETSEQERLRLADLWSFQRKEIEEAAPEIGEDATLENERRRLLNVARLAENTNTAHGALYEDAGSALEQIRTAWRKLDEASALDQSLAPIRDALQPAEITVEEAARELQSYLGRLEANPARLEEVESRLSTLGMLQRKYGRSIDEVLAFLADVKVKLTEMESSEERREELRREQERLADLFREVSGRLTRQRAAAARRLEKRLETELKSLAMERTTFRIEIVEAPWSPTGADRVRYLVSTNPGEELHPMEKVASGGELSRIALALKTCVAIEPKLQSGGGGAPRSLVFDEIDAGVGGSAAETVGRRLKAISAHSQVLCVTHLPQIAGFADHHYHVAKAETNGRTAATIAELEPAERIQEIGRMLSGQRLTPAALRHAEQLIRMSAEC